MTERALQAEVEGLRRELAKARSIIAEKDALLADRDAKIAQLSADIAALKKVVDSLLSPRRGGMRVPEGQGLLFADSAESHVADAPADEANGDDGAGIGEEDVDQDEADPPTTPRAPTKRRGKPGKLDTTGLPRRREVHDLDEAERVDPVSGKALVCIGERVTEELDYQRGRFEVIEHVQKLYGLPPEESELRAVDPKAAPVPPRPFENCIASAALLAWIIVQKFCNHLPLYRQQGIFERDGMRLSRKTQCDWALASAELLEPIVDCLMHKIRAGPPGGGDLGAVMQTDDTPVKCQGGRGERNFLARLWVFVNPEVSGVVYRFTPGRDSAALARLIGAFEGTLCGDGFSGNKAAARKAAEAAAEEVQERVGTDGLSPTIYLSGCYAHVNRKLRDAAKESQAVSSLLRGYVQQLYTIEREADEARLAPQQRRELRQLRSRPVVAQLLFHVRRLRDAFSDAGNMAKALDYIRNQRRALTRFLEDGRVPIDNNACERSIRPIAIGRRNWLFAGSMRGGRAAATVFSLVESCRVVGVDPLDYLADVLVRVSTHPASRVAELLPENWAERFGRPPAAELSQA